MPAALADDIALLATVRAHHLSGALVALSDVGAPFPAEDAADVYVGRRAGPEGSPGAILVLNDDENETRGLWVDTAPGAPPSLAGEVLIDVTGRVATATTVFPDGRAYFSAPPRSFTIWMPADAWSADRVPVFSGEGLTP